MKSAKAQQKGPRQKEGQISSLTAATVASFSRGDAFSIQPRRYVGYGSDSNLEAEQMLRDACHNTLDY